jgi:hypothetical protein
VLGTGAGQGEPSRAAGSQSKGQKIKTGSEDIFDGPRTERNSFSGEKPAGSWSVGAVLDSDQLEDTVTPVLVTGVTTLYGKEQWGGFLKVVRVHLRNRSEKTVIGARLEWHVVDRVTNVRLLSGATPQFYVYITGGAGAGLGRGPGTARPRRGAAAEAPGS